MAKTNIRDVNDQSKPKTKTQNDGVSKQSSKPYADRIRELKARIQNAGRVNPCQCKVPSISNSQEPEQKVPETMGGEDSSEEEEEVVAEEVDEIPAQIPPPLSRAYYAKEHEFKHFTEEIEEITDTIEEFTEIAKTEMKRKVLGMTTHWKRIRAMKYLKCAMRELQDEIAKGMERL